MEEVNDKKTVLSAPSENGEKKPRASLRSLLRNRQELARFSKFFIVGVLNTIVDLGVLNLLLFLFDPQGRSHSFVLFKALSFVAAVSCSFFLNRRFVFRDQRQEAPHRSARTEGKRFFLVSLVGFFLNVSIASAAYTILSRIAGGQVPVYALASVSALTGSAGALLWNYWGYKHWVFSK
jgi:putative flippase GtrA